MKRALCLGLLVMMALPANAARRDEFVNEPGYIDFGDVADFSNGDESVEIFLTQPLLKLVEGVIESDEPELGDLIENLALVKVDVFSFDWSDFDTLEAAVGTLTGTLIDKGWQQLVKVKSEDERVFVHALPIREERGDEERDIIAGITVMALEEEQAVFVNIVGKFDFEAIGQLIRRFDVPNVDIDDLPSSYRSRSQQERDDDDVDDDRN